MTETTKPQTTDQLYRETQRELMTLTLLCAIDLQKQMQGSELPDQVAIGERRAVMLAAAQSWKQLQIV